MKILGIHGNFGKADHDPAAVLTIDNNINEGDVLITSALEKTFPKGLLIGKVVKIQKNDQKPFQQAEVKPFFNLNGLDNLFVITNYKR